MLHDAMAKGKPPTLELARAPKLDYNAPANLSRPAAGARIPTREKGPTAERFSASVTRGPPRTL